MRYYKPFVLMSYIKQKIETIMKDEEGKDFSLFPFFLSVISFLYCGVVKLREIFYKKGILKSERLPCKVISVGNITVGGTGKTPMVIYLARLTERLGYKTVILSRGYKGKAEKTGGIVSDGKTIFMNPDMAGDEPYMMALKLKNIPVVVGKNRFKAGISADKIFKPDVIILDDAFQHLKLIRDIDLVLLDSRSPFGNKHLLPRGILREPLSALLRSDAFIMTRCNKDSRYDSITCGILKNKPVFKSFHLLYIHKIVKSSPKPSENMISAYEYNILKGCNIFLFSGIGENNQFRTSLGYFECNIAGYLDFPDHHFYSDDDLKMISKSAKSLNTDFIVTTEKDYVQIPEKNTFGVDLAVIAVDISFGDDSDDFDNFIKNALLKT